MTFYIEVKDEYDLCWRAVAKSSGKPRSFATKKKVKNFLRNHYSIASSPHKIVTKVTAKRRLRI